MLAAGLATASPRAAAHDYWIDRDAQGYTLFQGHVHSSHKGEDRVPYDPAIVKRILCARSEGEVVAVAPVRTMWSRPFEVGGTISSRAAYPRRMSST